MSCLMRPIRIEPIPAPGSPCKESNFKSISVGNLLALLESLCSESQADVFQSLWRTMWGSPSLTVEDINSEWIRNFLKQGGLHPTKKHPHLFSEEEADVGVTYQWTLGLGPEKGLLSFLIGVDPNLKLWLDVIFIDQMSNNIPLNLAKAQEIYGLLRFHFIFAGGKVELLDRGWCLFEILLRVKAGKESRVFSPENLGIRGKTYSYYDHMQLSVDEDKEAIQVALYFAFPGGKDEVKEFINKAVVKQVGAH